MEPSNIEYEPSSEYEYELLPEEYPEPFTEEELNTGKPLSIQEIQRLLREAHKELLEPSNIEYEPRSEYELLPEPITEEELNVTEEELNALGKAEEEFAAYERQKRRHLTPAEDKQITNELKAQRQQEAARQFGKEVDPTDFEDFLVSVGHKIIPIIGKFKLAYPTLTNEQLFNIIENLLVNSLNKISDSIIEKSPPLI